jgi:hypothetical protein
LLWRRPLAGQPPGRRRYFASGFRGNMNRLAIALVAYSVLGALAFATLSDFRIRTLTLLILGLFAFKSWVRRKDVLHPDGDSEPR